MADPAWRRPLDPGFAAQRGGRWNPPGSFPVIYLCATRDVARANVLRRFVGLPYGLIDVFPERRPVLIETDVPTDGRSTWCRTRDAGRRVCPSRTRSTGAGGSWGWGRTQPIGAIAWDQGEVSIAARSAASTKDERGKSSPGSSEPPTTGCVWRSGVASTTGSDPESPPPKQGPSVAGSFGP